MCQFSRSLKAVGIISLFIICTKSVIAANAIHFDDYAHRLGAVEIVTLQIPKNVISRNDSIDLVEKEYIENTLEIYSAFFDYHLKFDEKDIIDISKIEFDVQESKDGNLFIFHDKNFERFFKKFSGVHKTGLIELDSPSIKRLRYPNGEIIPELSDILDLTIEYLRKIHTSSFKPKKNKIKFYVEIKRMNRSNDFGWMKLLKQLSEFEKQLSYESLNYLNITCYVYSKKVFNKYVVSWDRWKELNTKAGSNIKLEIGWRLYNIFY
ncbi:hypothetical protein KJ966_15255 [bacterium]|nr:hypothetical protein [bacterium]